jgi:hypothetical protein
MTRHSGRRASRRAGRRGRRSDDAARTRSPEVRAEVAARLRGESRAYDPDGARILRTVEARISGDPAGNPAGSRPRGRSPVRALIGPSGRIWAPDGGWRSRCGSAPGVLGVAGAVIGVVAVTVVAVGSLSGGHGTQVYAVGAASSGPAASPGAPWDESAPTTRPSPAVGDAVSTTASGPWATPGAAGGATSGGGGGTRSAIGLTVVATSGNARFALPPSRARDWALYGAGGSLAQSVYDANPSAHLGKLTASGDLAVLDGGGARFSWTGGSPVATGRDDGRRLAVSTGSGRLRLSGTVVPGGETIVLHAGTVNGSGVARVTAGQHVSSAPLRGGVGAVEATITVRLQASLAGSPFTIVLSGGSAGGNRADSPGQPNPSSAKKGNAGNHSGHGNDNRATATPSSTATAAANAGTGSRSGGAASSAAAGLVTLASAILF